MAYSIFALELAGPLDTDSPLRGQLHELVVRHPEQATYADRSQLYGQVARLLLDWLPAVESGCWDYFNDHDRALKDYHMWCDGMVAREGARTEPSIVPGSPFRSAGERHYMTFTMAFLLLQDSNTDRTMRDRCNTLETRLGLWRRDVFANLLQAVPYLNFASVRSDVIYVIPGDPAYALTLADLAQPKFEYLRKLDG